MSNPTDLDVSAEERRFLLRTFHRLAFPYFAAFGVVLAFLAWSGPDSAGVGSSQDLAALRAEIEPLRAAVDELGAGVDRAGRERAATSKKIGALQGRLSAGSGGDIVALENAVAEVRKRIADIESRLAREAATERLAVLSDRIARLERGPGSGISESLAPAAAPSSPPARLDTP